MIKFYYLYSPSFKSIDTVDGAVQRAHAHTPVLGAVCISGLIGPSVKRLCLVLVVLRGDVLSEI